MSKQEKEYKLSPTARQYIRETKRRERLKTKKCSCGRQAWAKILLTQELKCSRCLVAPLKEEIIRENKPGEKK